MKRKQSDNQSRSRSRDKKKKRSYAQDSDSRSLSSYRSKSKEVLQKQLEHMLIKKQQSDFQKQLAQYRNKKRHQAEMLQQQYVDDDQSQIPIRERRRSRFLSSGSQEKSRQHSIKKSTQKKKQQFQRPDKNNQQEKSQEVNQQQWDAENSQLSFFQYLQSDSRSRPQPFTGIQQFPIFGLPEIVRPIIDSSVQKRPQQQPKNMKKKPVKKDAVQNNKKSQAIEKKLVQKKKKPVQKKKSQAVEKPVQKKKKSQAVEKKPVQNKKSQAVEKKPVQQGPIQQRPSQQPAQQRPAQEPAQQPAQRPAQRPAQEQKKVKEFKKKFIKRVTDPTLRFQQKQRLKRYFPQWAKKSAVKDELPRSAQGYVLDQFIEEDDIPVNWREQKGTNSYYGSLEQLSNRIDPTYQAPRSIIPPKPVVQRVSLPPQPIFTNKMRTFNLRQAIRGGGTTFSRQQRVNAFRQQLEARRIIRQRDQALRKAAKQVQSKLRQADRISKQRANRQFQQFMRQQAQKKQLKKSKAIDKNKYKKPKPKYEKKLTDKLKKIPKKDDDDQVSVYQEQLPEEDQQMEQQMEQQDSVQIIPYQYQPIISIPDQPKNSIQSNSLAPIMPPGITGELRPSTGWGLSYSQPVAPPMPSFINIAPAEPLPGFGTKPRQKTSLEKFQQFANQLKNKDTQLLQLSLGAAQNRPSVPPRPLPLPLPLPLSSAPLVISNPPQSKKAQQIEQARQILKQTELLAKKTAQAIQNHQKNTRQQKTRLINRQKQARQYLKKKILAEVRKQQRNQRQKINRTSVNRRQRQGIIPLVYNGVYDIVYNQREDKSWIGQYVSRQDHFYFTNRCVNCNKLFAKNILKAYAKLLSHQRPRGNNKIIEQVEGTRIIFIFDYYKSRPYIALRLTTYDQRTQKSYITKNGFNLTPQQMETLIQRLKEVVFQPM